MKLLIRQTRFFNRIINSPATSTSRPTAPVDPDSRPETSTSRPAAPAAPENRPATPSTSRPAAPAAPESRPATPSIQTSRPAAPAAPESGPATSTSRPTAPAAPDSQPATPPIQTSRSVAPAAPESRSATPSTSTSRSTAPAATASRPATVLVELPPATTKVPKILHRSTATSAVIKGAWSYTDEVPVPTLPRATAALKEGTIQVQVTSSKARKEVPLAICDPENGTRKSKRRRMEKSFADDVDSTSDPLRKPTLCAALPCRKVKLLLHAVMFVILIHYAYYFI